MLTTPFFRMLKPENLELSLTPLFFQNPHVIHLEILLAPPSKYIQNLIASYRSLLHYYLSKSPPSLSRIIAVASQLVCLLCVLSCNQRDLIARLLTTLQIFSISLSMKAKGLPMPYEAIWSPHYSHNGLLPVPQIRQLIFSSWPSPLLSSCLNALSQVFPWPIHSLQSFAQMSSSLRLSLLSLSKLVAKHAYLTSPFQLFSL